MEFSNQYPYLNEKLPLEERVNDLISRLTLEEKVSLMPTAQAAVPRLGIKEYSIGGEAAHGVAWIGEATVFPQTIGMAGTWDTKLMQEIGDITGDEYRVYYQKSGETRGLTIWFPTVDMERDPRWGRTEEAYGEDPWLTGKMAGALVKSLQGTHSFYLRAVATAKHFFANNNEKDRIRSSSSIDPRNMREYYLEPFRRLITESGAKCLMTAYNQVNGIPIMVNSLLRRVIKEQWELDGFVVCDAGAFRQVVNDHKYCKTHAETAALSIKSGVDSLTDEPELVIQSLTEALEKGLINESELDRALMNIFKMRFRYGQFDTSGNNPWENIPDSVLCCKKHCETAYRAAQKSIILLKNEAHFLPLNKEKIHKIAVIGPMANRLYNDWYSGTYPYRVTILDGLKKKHPDAQLTFVEGADIIRLKSVATGKYVEPDENGNLYASGDKPSEKSDYRLMDWGWGSYTLQSCSNGKFVTCDKKLSATKDNVFGWFVKEVFNFIPQGEDAYTVKAWNGEKIGVLLENGSLQERDGLFSDKEDSFVLEKVSSGINNAVAAAKDADIVLLAFGNNPVINGKEEVDRPDITLPPLQEKLLREVYSANPSTVLILVASYPMTINWAQENLPAIMHLPHGGQEMGNAVADVLYGDYNPAGRLPMTWVKSAEQLPPMLDYDIINGKRTYMYFDGDPLYPFGFGLSYSKFNYNNLVIHEKEICWNQPVQVSVDVTNEGPMDGDEVVQLYVRFEGSRVKRPRKQLKGFERLSLKAGETGTVHFLLDPAELCFWDVTREVDCFETSLCTIMVGASSKDIRLSKTLPINGETIPPRDLTLKTWAENYDHYHGVFLDEYKENRSCVKSLGKNSWIAFKQVQFSSMMKNMRARVSSKGCGANAEVRLDAVDGRKIGSFSIPNTDTLAVPDWKTVPAWATVACSIEATDEIHDLYIVFDNAAGLSWIQFLK